MLDKTEYKRALNNIKLNYDAEHVNECNDEWCQHMKREVSILENLVEEYFELVEKHKELGKALDKACEELSETMSIINFEGNIVSNKEEWREWCLE